MNIFRSIKNRVCLKKTLYLAEQRSGFLLSDGCIFEGESNSDVTLKTYKSFQHGKTVE